LIRPGRDLDAVQNSARGVFRWAMALFMHSTRQKAGARSCPRWEIYSNSLFLSDLFQFLELEPQVMDPENPLPSKQINTGEDHFSRHLVQLPG
jgi:hypothetical protein